MRRSLGIFAKRPTPGEVKTRLAARTSQVFAARVAEAFFLDGLERWQRVGTPVTIVYAPDDARECFGNLIGSNVALEPQGSGDLGERLRRFFEMQFLVGADCVVVVGTDSPTLPLYRIRAAFEALEENAAVIGPATDGGYYLLGCSKPLPKLFADIDWSTAQVLQQTVERLEHLGVPWRMLEPWYDVDTWEDWQMLSGHLRGLDPEEWPRIRALVGESANRAT